MTTNKNIIKLCSEDILDSNKYPDLKKYQETYKKIEELHNTFDSVEIVFDKSIVSLHPLFILYIYRYYDHCIHDNNNKILFFINSFNDDNQFKILHYFMQYIDYNIAKIESSLLSRERLVNEKIIIYSTVKDKFNKISLNENKYYKTLPITKITPLKGKSTIEDFDKSVKDLLFRREKFYIGNLVNEEIIKQYNENSNKKINSEDVWEKIFHNFLDIPSMDNETKNSFSILLNECKKNIQEHTQKQEIENANGYICFYELDKKNEFIIYDDYIEGFLQTYKRTLDEEKIKLEKDFESDSDGIYNNIYKQYIENIQKIKENSTESNKDIIKDIFDNEERFSIHQAGRIIMHFGFPAILKIIDMINANQEQLSSSDIATLTLYIHNKEKSYKVIYCSNKELEIEELEDNTLRGTILIISLPKKSKLEFSKNDSNANDDSRISFSSKHYKKVLIEKTTINEIVGKFKSTYKRNTPLKIRFDKEEKDISVFFRKVLGQAFKKNINDILIYNFPINKYKLYIQLLIDIIFANNREYKTTGINILLFNDCEPKAFFIGGKTKTECCKINSNILNHFNLHSATFANLLACENDNSTIEIKSDLFYTKGSLVHFELFIQNKNDNSYSLLYTDMMNNFLENEDEKNYINERVNTEYGFIINKFYLYKNIFEDSIWVKRIAFDLAYRVKQHGVSKYNIIGIGQYSSDILSVFKTIIDEKNEIIIVNDLDSKEYEKYFDESCYTIIFIPIILSGKKIKTFLENNNIELYKIYCSINLVCKQILCEYKNNNSQFEPFLQKNIEENIEKIDNTNDYNNEKTPLYEIDSDGYSLAQYFQDDIEKTDTKINEDVSWKNSIKYGHTERGNNHYLYYIKTVQFLHNNIDLIERKFEKYKEEIDQKKYNVILCSAHDTNAQFVSTVNELVFDNDAKVHKFDLNDFEKTYNSIKNLKSKFESCDNCIFHFVDDCMATGSTLQKLHKILLKISNKIKFNYAFTLIDRSKNQDNKDRYIENELVTLTTLNIKPIKAGPEKCYLCKHKEEFEKLEKKSSLVFMKHQFRKKINKLDEKHSFEIEYLNNESQMEDFKDYLKLYGVEYISNHLDKSCMINYYESYCSHISKYFIKYYLNNDEKQFIEPIKIIVRFEAKIAFIKSLTFPKISYIPKIRKEIETYIVGEIEGLITESEKNQKFIKFILNEDEYKVIENKSEYKDLFSSSKNTYQYKMKCNIDYFNFLILRLAFLKNDFAIYKKCIGFFYKFSQILRDITNKPRFNEEYKKNLLQKYPIAVKILTSYNIANSQLFYEQLKRFIDSIRGDSKYLEYISKNSLIFSMIVENIEYKSIYKKSFKEKLDNVDKDLNDQEKLKIISKLIIEIIERAYEFKPENLRLYIDINNNNSKYVDIFNDYRENIDDNYIDIVNQGAVKNVEEETDIIDIIKIEDKNGDSKHNTWSNFYKINKNYVRIIKSIIPGGVFVYDTNTLKEHLKSSKIILMLQDIIVDYIDKNNLVSIETYTTKIDLSAKMAILGNIDHNHKSIYEELKNYRRTNNLTDNEGQLIYYTFSSKYQLLSNFNYSINAVHTKININLPVCYDFISALTKFYHSKKIYENMRGKNFNIKFDLGKEFNIVLDGLAIKSIIFEIIANAYKYSENNDCKVLIKTYKEDLYFLNNGTNITEEKIETLFKLKKKNGKISGNGLYFIKEVLTKNAYDIEYLPMVEFKSEELSSTFILKISKKEKNGPK